MKHKISTTVVLLSVLIAFIIKNMLISGVLYGLSVSVILGLTIVSISLSMPNFTLLKKVKAGNFKATDKTTRVKKFVQLIEEQNYVSKKKERITIAIGIVFIFIPQLIVYLDIEYALIFQYTFEVASFISLACFFLSSYSQFEIYKSVIQKSKDGK